jgi:aldose 1-epimerase
MLKIAIKSVIFPLTWQVNEMNLSITNFGQNDKKEPITEFTLTNPSGFGISVLNYGGIVTRLMAPDRDGALANVVLGYDKFQDYQHRNPYFGALIGRYANRIDSGELNIAHERYRLSQNNGPHHLHGGHKGFDKVIWTVEPQVTPKKASLKFSYTSKNNEEGYPGNLKVTVIYTIDLNNEWTIDYRATTDKDTVFNPTQHSYFNLSGDFNREIVDHRVQLMPTHYLPLNSELIPQGILSSVNDSAFDFREPKTIEAQLDLLLNQSSMETGFDHCFVFGDGQNDLRKIAQVDHDLSGRTLEVFTTQPGVQFYTAKFSKDQYPNPQGGFYKDRTGFCLETQNWPNAPNQASFPSALLMAGLTYKSRTIYKFSIQ